MTVKLLTSYLESMVSGSKHFDLILRGEKPYLDKADFDYVEKNDNYLFKFSFKLFEHCPLS